MQLEETRTTRDYLFGRLFAIAENIERLALKRSGEERETNAIRLMPRFADQPCPTWRILEPKLVPYKMRLRANEPAALTRRERLIDAIIELFQGNDFLKEGKLSCEFLLGYYCQRAALWKKKPGESGAVEQEGLEEDGGDDE